MDLKEILEKHILWLNNNPNGARAYLYRADLSGANLSGANLSGADLSGAILSSYTICPEIGAFDAWKAVNYHDRKVVIKIRIPAKAKRTSSLVGRKCRAEYVKVLDGEGESNTCNKEKRLYYKKGEIVRADSFDDDIRVECSHGIHFFMTKKEAEEW